MSHLSFWLGASVYFGGLVALGAIAAPAVFYAANHSGMTMPGIGPALDMGNQVGGEIFGEVLNRFVLIEVISLVLLGVGIGVPMVTHRPMRKSTSLLFSLWLGVVVLMVYTAAYLHPKIWHEREVLRASAMTRPAATQTAVPAKNAVVAAWPEKEEFDSLHARAETLARIKAYLLLAMIVVGSMRGITESPVQLRKKRVAAVEGTRG
ncbi:MAG: hypothetical protein ACTHN5_11605 [Phycisphaerae bacterium]